MYSSRTLSLFVIVMVVLAGCAGGGDVAPNGDTETPSGETVDGDRDDAEAFSLGDTEQTLREAGSFTVTWQYTGVDRNGIETDVTREFYADLGAERSHTVIATGDGGDDSVTSEQFVANGVTYARTGSGDAASYAVYEGTTDVVGTAIALSQARAYGADDDLAYRGSETFDGVAVDRYELSAASSALIRAGGVAAGSADEFELTDFEYTVLVDEDGLSRYEAWSFAGRTPDGETVSGEWTYSLTGVGSTTVPDPEWLAEAQAQAAN
jgi:hypothetical protein